MQTAGVGYLSRHFITSVSKNLRKLLHINGFYWGHRQLLNKEKVFRERSCKSKGFILLHGGGPVTALIAMLAFVATPICGDIGAREHKLYGYAVLHAHV